jgi:hypothetical protein
MGRGEGRMGRGVEFNARGAAGVAGAYATAGIKKSCRFALAPNTPAVSCATADSEWRPGTYRAACVCCSAGRGQHRHRYADGWARWSGRADTAPADRIRH